MRKWLSILLLLCFPLLIHAEGPFDVANPAEVIGVADPDEMIGVAGLAGSACGSTGSYDENFDTTGYCNADLETNEDAAGTNALDPDDSSPATGTYSLFVDVNSASDDCYTYDDITSHSSGTMYYKFDITVSDSFGGEWSEVGALFIQDTTNFSDIPYRADSLAIDIRDVGSNWRISVEASDGTTQSNSSMSFGTTYTIRIKSNDDWVTNGVEWCIDTSTQTTAYAGSGDDRDTSQVYFGSNSGEMYTTVEYNIDEFVQSTNAADVGWSGCS